MTNTAGVALQQEAKSVGQSPTPTAIEYWETRKLTEVLTSGTILQTFIVDGNPDKARLDSGLAGFRCGDVHPWAGVVGVSANLVTYGNYDWAKDYYLEKREFEVWVDSAIEGNRKTLATFEWRKRTCPYLYEEEMRGAYVSYPCWYSLDKHPNPLLFPKSPMTYQFPVTMLTRRYPLCHIYQDEVEKLMAYQGHTNHVPFAGQPEGVWLLDSVVAKRLWGKPHNDQLVPDEIGSTEEVWDVALTFRSDPYRHHELWMLDMTPDNIPPVPEGWIPPETGGLAAAHWALRPLHYHRTMFLPADTEFDKLIPMTGKNRCLPYYASRTA